LELEVQGNLSNVRKRVVKLLGKRTLFFRKNPP
jgi:hypothetical protein